MWKRFCLIGTLIASSLVIAFLIVEVALRIIGYSNPAFHTTDRDLGHTPWPGTEGWHQSEGRAYVTINSDGLRDREHNTDKPPNTVRIAILGDSMTAALSVPIEQTYWGVLEKNLNAECGILGEKSVEVINFGVSGYSNGNELAVLRSKVWKYEPDLIILEFYAQNDVRENIKILSKNHMRPFFVLKNGELIVDNSFRDTEYFRFRDGPVGRFVHSVVRWSRAAQLVNAGRFIVELKIRLFLRSKRIKSNDKFEQEGGVDVGLDSNIYAEPNYPAWREAWQITEAIIVTMANEILARKAHFLVFTATDPMQVTTDSRKLREYMEKIGVKDLFYPERWTEEILGKKHGIDTLTTLAPVLQRIAMDTSVCFHGFSNTTLCRGHWNSRGHKQVGELLTSKVCSDVLPRIVKGTSLKGAANLSGFR